MSARGRISVASRLPALTVALLVAGSAFAQAPAPTARELATKFVHDPTNATMLDDTREQMLATVMEKGKNLPPSVKSWMATALPAAAEQVMSDMLPVMEERLIDVYSKKFTAEELQQILDFQLFVRQPHIVKAISEASSEPTTAARMEIIKSRLSTADFDRVMTETTKHPMLTMTVETLKLTQEITTEFVKRFNVAVQQHCATAPQGFPLCENQGRAL